MDHYALHIVIDKEDHFLIWRGNSDSSPDTLIAQGGVVVDYRDLARLRLYADTLGIELHVQEVFFDFDRIAQWVAEPNYQLDAEELIDAWNLVIDVADVNLDLSLKFRERSRELAPVHASLTQKAVPQVLLTGIVICFELQAAETRQLRELMTLGLTLLRRALIQHRGLGS